MKNKTASLIDMVKLSHNTELSEPYIRYLCGIKNEQQYRHQEILDISAIIGQLSVADSKLSDFIYGYVVPQLNKEFDLIKITENSCLNIELKGGDVAREKIQRQLIQNRHYLKLLNKPNLLLYTYISSTGELIRLDDSNNLIECALDELSRVLNLMDDKAEQVDLDSVFTPNNILVSPLNATERFLRGDYLLTENQENIKKNILSYICGITTDRFVGLTGGPGTGKTLLIYDIACELAKKQTILMVHSGILCYGHYMLDQKLNNIKIISAKELRLREIRDVDIVIVDEAHRLYTESLEKVERWVKRAKTTCLFSYDAGQMLSVAERYRNTAQRIDQLCLSHIFKLTNKIRTNKELALFITCLRDLTKYRDEYSFPNVQIFYEPRKSNAMRKVEELKKSGYTFISYTPSKVNHEIDYQSDQYNTHTVIGQEFDGVCMLIGDYFFYTPEGKLAARTHPNPDYLFRQLLYQGLTRVRSKIALIVMSESILQSILQLMKNN